MESDPRLVYALLAPLLGAGLVMATGKKPNLREAISFLAACTLFGFVASLVPDVLAGKTVHFTVAQLLPATGRFQGLSFALRADGLSMVFALAASFLWIIAVFYAAGYMRGHHEANQTRFNTCFALALFGAVGGAFADNLLTLYFFYEVVSVSTYPLVAHHQDEEGYAGAQKYLVYLTTTAKALILPAMVLIYVLSGTLDFAHNANTGILPAGAHNGIIIALYAACILGFAKNGVMPFHSWLPSAMVAPTPVSALLHAVAVVKIGVFSTVRVMLYVFGVDLMDRLHLGLPTACFVSITILLGSVIALSKDNLKARLAYSTVSQLSYVILGVALLNPIGVEGGLFHIAAHAFSKITLFFCAGAIYVTAHKKDISEMGGLGRKMPWTFGAFAVAALSMIGAPPVAGFVSKLYMLVGSLEAHSYFILAVLIGSSLLNAAYFAPVVYHAFFGKPAAVNAGHGAADHGHGHDDHGHGHDHHGHGEAPLSMLIPLCISAVISVAIGLYPDLIMQFVKGIVQ
ncbi:MAG TPA: monovalent cation/H+ antiporter subunit D family protein [Opitutaceae bacterium]|nr:monovalent cation/H+ antiporter subunit D family protein [Opitutaceae bacterium]